MSRCAQRLSASRLSGGGSRRKSSARSTVLNAFRHHGCRERPRPPPSPAPTGAQRLSASRLSGDGLVDGRRAMSAPCSTPFGITAVGRRRDARWHPPLDVLNAFRHHGCREADLRLRCAPRRAVLNAFRHHGCRELQPQHRLACLHDQCSTPFGITAVGSGDSLPLVVMCEKVLNAFRHHGCREVSQVASKVLASSAQRLSASRLSGAVTGTTQRPPRQVLNAFRHHGCREEGVGERGHREGGRCSTPFGITAVGSPPAQPGRPPAARAQRLSASRLSGGVGGKGAPDLFWCSTPFGITAVGRHRYVRSDALSAECSTPFGITAVGSG